MADKIKEEKTPFDVALDYLEKCARSEKEVKDKLYKKGYSKQQVEDTLSKLKEYRFIDDTEYVKQFLFFYKNKFGKKQLELKLTAVKGVDRKLVGEILDEQLSDDEELLKAVTFSKKYISQKKLDSSKESKAKLANWLYSKGFEWDIINRAISEVGDDFIPPDDEV